jgi:lipopolysaccharide/colanic/teichoic acid biosynthesis glycosyltransferase
MKCSEDEMKRLIDILGALMGLIVLSPFLGFAMFLIWKQDHHSPFYIAPRVGKDGRTFNMVKLRSMIMNADKTGVDSTSTNDSRITPIGHFVRKYKLDELMQLWNVFKGDMSLVGPRPNVKRETGLYTRIERHLLDVKPGITDFSSIVFSDENEILSGSKNPDIDYNQLIRPWKSRLGLFYVDKRSIWVDFQLIYLTIITVISRERSLSGVSKVLKGLGALPELIRIAQRKEPLEPTHPPGSDEIVTSRELL